MSRASLVVTMGERPRLCADQRLGPRVRAIDCYELGCAALAGAAGLLIGMHCDQLRLERLRDELDRYVAAGGRAAVCGQVTRPFLAGLERLEWLTDYSVADLEVRRLASHPVWADVDPGDLTLRRGVAGFYGRAFWPHPPRGALVVHGLGAAGRPLDVVYPHGQGEVLVHGGNDLWGYLDGPGSAARMAPQLLDWLERR